MRTNFRNYLKQGKSNNYLEAEQEGKFKSGEAAKILSKKFKTKITAKELAPFTGEYHHAGVFKGYSGKLTGRKVKFFTLQQLDAITLDDILLSRNVESIVAEEGNRIVKGWYVTFQKVSINRFGKLGYKPFLSLYEGKKSGQPKNFTELLDEVYLDAKAYEGKQLKPYAKYYYETI
jgi:hypothetical protein